MSLRLYELRWKENNEKYVEPSKKKNQRNSYAEAIRIFGDYGWSSSEAYLYWIEKDGVKLFEPCYWEDVPKEEPVGDEYKVREGNWLTQYNEEETQTMAAATKVFDYTTVLHGEPSKDNAGNDTTKDSIILDVGRIVAKSEEHVKLIAARSEKLAKLTPEELGRLDVKVKPF